MIDRYHYWARPLSLRRMMDQLLANAYVLPQSAEAMQPAAHTLNAYEEGDHLILEAHLPGFQPEDVNLTVEQGILTIRAQARAEEERKERSYVLREHRANRFVRSVRLPDAVDVDAATATYQHGVLKLTFPKAEPARPRRVSIATCGQEALGSAPSGQPDAMPSGSSAASSSEPDAANPTHAGGTASGEAHQEAAPAAMQATKRPKTRPSGEKASRRKAADSNGTGRKGTAKKEAVGAGA